MKDRPVFPHTGLGHRRRAIAVLAAWMALASGAALAQTGNAGINVTGVIGGGSCAITTNPVDLGTHDASEFTGIGSSPASGWVNFGITSAGCSADITTLHMGFDGTADTNNNGLFAIAPGGASGIGIQLETEDGATTVIPNSATQLVNWTTNFFSGASYPMRARYVQTRATVTPGAADSTVTVMLSYN